MTKTSQRKKDQRTDPANRVIATNRLARRNFDILEELECGISLLGSEVKALREARARLDEAFGRIIDGQLWLIGLHIQPYSQAHGFGSHDPDRQRRLLAHRGEIERWRAVVEQQHLTLVPLQLYLSDGRVKVLMAMARGRKTYDKRRVLAERDAELETRRAVATALKRAPD
jgi:SsrA-binding protein